MNSNNSEMYSAAANEPVPCITIDNSGESVEEEEDLFTEFFFVKPTTSNSASNTGLQQTTRKDITPQRESIHHDTNQQTIRHPVPEDTSDCEIVYENGLQQDAHQGEESDNVLDMDAMNGYVDPNVLNAQQIQQDYSHEYEDGMHHGSNLQAVEYEMMTAGGPIRRPKTRNPPSSDPLSARRRARSKNYKIAPEESFRDLPLVHVDGRTILTENVAKRLVLELSSRGLAQGYFAERVLGIKQSAFSELICTPKENMRTRGFQKYWKLITWLEMSEEDKFKVLNRDIVFCTSEEESETVPEPEKENMPAEDAPKDKKTKKARTQFTPDQLTALQSSYKGNRYPNKEEKKQLAIQLNLPCQTVENWFVNTRRRSPIVAPEQPDK